MQTKSPFKSKTIWACTITLVLALLGLFAASKGEAPKTWEDLGRPHNRQIFALIAIVQLGSGALGIKGRYDANSRIRRRGDET